MPVAVAVFLGLAVLKAAGPILSAPRRAKHVIVVGCDALTPVGQVCLAGGTEGRQ